jgi:TRAP-type C4-dicarboxylate transport system permease small subunit
MTEAPSLLLPGQRHLKWRSLDWLERTLMALCGICLLGFSSAVLADIITRQAGAPWRSAQEVTDTFFIYGIFLGAAVATRRNDHLTLTAIAEALQGRARLAIELLTRSVVLAVAVAMLVFGWQNFLGGFTSYRMPSMTPIASLYGAIPLAGALIALFAIEQMVNGVRHGFTGHPAEPVWLGNPAIPSTGTMHER